MKTRLALGILFLTTTLVACAKPPQAELDAAKAKLAEAEAAEASTYAPDAVAEAQQAVAAAEAEIAAQGEKLAFLRSYDSAKELISSAETKSAAARDAAAEGKAAAKADAEAAVQGAQDALATAQSTLASLDECKRKPKDFASQVELLSGSLSGLQTRVDELPALIESERYAAAKEQAAALTGEIGTYSADLDAAKAKLGC